MTPPPNTLTEIAALMSQPSDIVTAFTAALGRSFLGEELFDAVADTVFFVKDAEGRYVAVNETLVARTGRASKSGLIGRRADEIFPGELGRQMGAQDRSVIATGTAVVAKLELHLYAGGDEGWCLTWKEPLRDVSGRIVGLTGISRDLAAMPTGDKGMAALARIIDVIEGDLSLDPPLDQLAHRAGLTRFQLDQRIRALFGLSTAQYVTRARINQARGLLRRGDDSVADIALQCGYADQAAFTRAFRKAVGLTPSQYQKRHRG
jgi:AraC-like DNA-binding protein